MDLKLSSSVFKEGDLINDRFTCNGEDISPELTWNKGDSTIKSWALIVDDPDASRGGFTHWVIYNLPASLNRLEQNVPQQQQLTNGALQGKNDAMKIGYTGPCPPRGPAHHYIFNLYALDNMLNLSGGASKKQVLDAMKGHIVGQTKLTALYQNK